MQKSEFVIDMNGYDRGFIDGMRAFAHWKNGQELVGTTGKTLKDAIEKRMEIWSYTPF